MRLRRKKGLQNRLYADLKMLKVGKFTSESRGKKGLNAGPKSTGTPVSADASLLLVHRFIRCRYWYNRYSSDSIIRASAPVTFAEF